MLNLAWLLALIQSSSSTAEEEYLIMRQGIVAGATLAVLVPVIIALLCFASYMRSKRLNPYASSHSLSSPHRRSRESLRSYHFHHDSSNASPHKRSRESLRAFNHHDFNNASPHRRSRESLRSLNHHNHHHYHDFADAPIKLSRSAVSTPRLVTERPVQTSFAPNAPSYTSDDSTSRYFQPDSTVPKSHHLPSDHIYSNASSDSSTESSDSSNESFDYKHRHGIAAPNKFEAEYFTNEPLNDKPVVFQNTEWDLSYPEKTQSGSAITASRESCV